MNIFATTMDVIRMELYEYHPEDVAESIGKSLACIYAIRRGKTRWPRWDTFFALCEYLGIEVRLELKEQY